MIIRGSGVCRLKKNVYLIQQHAATKLHYDFRIQIGDALKSWVLPKGPSLSPKERRLAILTFDHDLSYRNFEGVIEEGYGAGEVLLWDRGTYRNLKEASIDTCFKQGRIEIGITGKKLKGGFALIRTHGKNWLLIKMRDRYADDDSNITKSAPHSVKSGKLITEI